VPTRRAAERQRRWYDKRRHFQARSRELVPNGSEAEGGSYVEDFASPKIWRDTDDEKRDELTERIWEKLATTDDPVIEAQLFEVLTRIDLLEDEAAR
jgi:hypothetical protein